MEQKLDAILAPEEPGKALHPLLQVLVDNFNVPLEQVIPLDAQAGRSMGSLKPLKERLIQAKLVTGEVYQQAVAKLFDLEYVPHLDQAEILPEFTEAIPIRYAKKFVFFPIRMTEEALVVAVEDPEALHPVKDVGRRFNRRVDPVISTHQSILTLINRAYERAQSANEEEIDGFDENMAGAQEGFGIEEPEDLLDARDEEPIKRLLNNILYQAARNNASDVHIEAGPSEVNVRFRVDGVLHTASTLTKAVLRSLINRIKIMSRLDISQHGLPQDGRTLIIIAGRHIDIRVSTLPTVNGEKAVMRLLYQDQELFALPKLGLPKTVYEELTRVLHQSGGIVLVSGPTGSGKTTTLYAALGEIDHHSRNIMTIEDPVEYKTPGYVQTEVNPKLGLTFSNALRSVLRQDPDVIMVGEMRDKETALIAIQAALTGHLVFSTVHTNNATATVTRLVDMGIEPYLVSSTVMAVLAQRLVRKICQNCKVDMPSDKKLLQKLGLTEKEMNGDFRLYKGEGCPQCNGTGYKGRVGMFEYLKMTDKVKTVLNTSSESNIIRAVAVKEGMMTMRTYGLDLVQKGITTVEEVLQVTREE